MFCGPPIEGKMALQAAVLGRKLSRGTYLVKFECISSFYSFIKTFLSK